MSSDPVVEKKKILKDGKKKKYSSCGTTYYL